MPRTLLDQDTADITHAILAGLDHSDEDLDHDGDDEGYEAVSGNRYVAVLAGGGGSAGGQLWRKRST